MPNTGVSRMAPAPCSEKTELLENLKASISAAITVNNRLLEAAIAGDLDQLDVLNTELRKTRACKDNMMHAYCQHVNQHRC